jgi:hypothetical protein
LFFEAHGQGPLGSRFFDPAVSAKLVFAALRDTSLHRVFPTVSIAAVTDRDYSRASPPAQDEYRRMSTTAGRDRQHDKDGFE